MKKEDALIQPLGEMVEIDGSYMSVYTEGDGPKTLVFLSGERTTSPILDFKSLYSLLSPDYKIVVLERFGHGFSDGKGTPREVKNILQEDRKALEEANIPGPYILCPHSMAGIEALSWAQQFPQEVAGIVGLDMGLPDAYKDYEPNQNLLSLEANFGQAGICRLGNLSDNPAILHGTLTDKEKELYRLITYRKTLTPEVVEEITYIDQGAKQVLEQPLPKVPMLLFASDGSEGTGYSKEEWRKFQKDFADKTNAKLIYLDCGHYVHDYKYQEIAQEMKEFLK